MGRTRASFFDNGQHLLRTLLSRYKYSGNKLVNTINTSISVHLFVGRYWRRGGFIWLWLGGSAAVILGIISAFTGSGVTAVIAVATLVLTVLDQVWSFRGFHKGRAYGGNDGELRLFDTELVDRRYVSAEHFHFSKLVNRTSDAQILEIRPSNDDSPTVNWIEFDSSISRYLLKPGHIECLKASDGGFFHFNAGDVLRDSEQHRRAQIQVLEILRQDAKDKHKSFFDAKKLSLGKLDFKGERLCAKLGSTTYFCSMVTNDAAAKVVGDGVRMISLETLSMFPRNPSPFQEESGKTFTLDSISNTRGLSNHIGSVVVAVSSEGRPVLCFQRRNANINAASSVLSGAGSLEYSDFFHSNADQTGYLDDAIRYGMARELLEETGGVWQDSFRRFDRDQLRRYSQRIQLAGFYRDLRRGGFPIFVGFCRMEADFASIIDRGGSKIWGIPSPRETKIDADLPRKQISTVSEYQDYLRSNIMQPQGENRRIPSDQVLVVDRLLDLEPVAAHFQLVLDRPL